MTRSLDAEHWRKRAELLRQTAEASVDDESKRRSKELATIYDRNAVRAEEFQRDPIGYVRNGIPIY